MAKIKVIPIPKEEMAVIKAIVEMNKQIVEALCSPAIVVEKEDEE